jgi:hypothetical protein
MDVIAEARNGVGARGAAARRLGMAVRRLARCAFAATCVLPATLGWLPGRSSQTLTVRRTDRPADFLTLAGSA